MGALSLSAGMVMRLRAAPLGSWWSFGVGVAAGVGVGVAVGARRVVGRREGFEVRAGDWAVVSVGALLAIGGAEWLEQPKRPTATMAAVTAMTTPRRTMIISRC